MIEKWFKYIEDGLYHHVCIADNKLYIDGKLIGEAGDGK